MEKPLAETRLVVSGRDVVVVKSDQQLVSALSNPGQSCLSFIVDLPRPLGELAEIANDAGAFAVGVARPEHTVSGSPKQPASVGANQQRKRAPSCYAFPTCHPPGFTP